MTAAAKQRAVLFAGCKPEVAAGPDGRILAVGAGARSAAGRGAEVVRLRGAAWPGLIDAHIHLEGLADRHTTLELAGTRSLEATLKRVERWSKALPRTAWVSGAGWYNDAWPDPAFPTRQQLDRAAGGRPVYLRRKDGHSAWVSSAALALAGVDRTTPDPPGGVFDRDDLGEPTGIIRELAMDAVARVEPQPTDPDLDRGLARALAALTRLGVTGVHSMDSARGFAPLQRLHARGKLPLRVTYNLPLADLRHAERMGVRSGWGDVWLRFWGVKAFLDGSLGSRTAEMLDGAGTPRLAQPELVDMIDRCIRAELNVCLHAIGDGAVRRARWHPELAVSKASALRAYTADAAYAAGMEDDVGFLKPGFLCDLTVVHDGKVEATVVGGRVRWRRPGAASPRSASSARSRSSRR